MIGVKNIYLNFEKIINGKSAGKIVSLGFHPFQRFSRSHRLQFVLVPHNKRTFPLTDSGFHLNQIFLRFLVDESLPKVEPFHLVALFDSESFQYVHFLDEVWIVLDFLRLLDGNRVRFGLDWAGILGFGVLVGEVQVELFFHSEEEFLGVGPDLCSVSGSDEFLYFFPVFAVDLQTCVKKIHT